MRLARRHALLALAAALPATLPPARARAQAGDPRLAERSAGKADAPVTVQEFFSLTCGHCAAFHRDTWPEVKRQLVDTGQVRMVWRDFPLDRTALAAAAVARALPPERYEGFIGILLNTQDRWAFRPDAIEELQKMAALAGLSRQQFEVVRNDEPYLRAILAGRMEAEREFQIQATPTFAFQSGGRTRMHGGNMPFEQFQRLVQEVRRG
ncbi:MAG: DsbA family protein [Acetobacteraceae bacterium]|nr:DsbA family protein [Acetobacteraceae bacterium]